MINSGRIKKTLCFLDREYNRHLTSADPERPVLFAKMAVLEYCGWLEESFDEVARNCVRRKLKTVAKREVLEKRIDNTHGFKYKESIRPLLAIGLGTIRLLDIERQLDKDGSLERLRSNLGSLNQMRKEAAHTFTSGRTSRFEAPSLIITNFEQTEPTIRKLWALVRQ